MIKANVHETAKTAWYNRVSNPEFYRFKMFHCEFSHNCYCYSHRITEDTMYLSYTYSLFRAFPFVAYFRYL